MQKQTSQHCRMQYDNDFVSRHTFTLTLSRGLGIAVEESRDSENELGIYIREIVPGSDAAEDGRLQVGDRVLAINEHCLYATSLREAKSVLRDLKLRHINENVIVQVTRPRRVSQNLSPSAPHIEDSHSAIDNSLHRHQEPTSFRPVMTSTPVRHTFPSSVFGTDSTSLPKRHDKPTSSSANKIHSHLVVPGDSLANQSRRGSPSAHRSNIAHCVPIDISPSSQTLSQNLHRSLNSLAEIENSPLNLLLHPSNKIEVERLENALLYLGLNMSEEEYYKLHNVLNIDHEGFVVFSEFVKAVRKVLANGKFRSISRDGLQSMKTFSVSNLSSNSLPCTTVPHLNNFDEIRTLKYEQRSLLNDARKLKELIAERNTALCSSQEQLFRLKRDLGYMAKEKKRLTERIEDHLSKTSQSRAKHKEYETVIARLELELANAKIRASTPKENSIKTIKQQIAELAIQLRKTEEKKNSLETSTNKLLDFAKRVHQVSRQSTYTSPAKPGKVTYSTGVDERDSTWRQKVTGVLPYNSFNPRSRFLYESARDTMQSVKSLIDIEIPELLYGTEEAYLPDGRRFYVDHLAGETFWSPPFQT